MKVIAAIDSFKGSLSTFRAGEAVKTGIGQVYPDAEVVISPVADGGEGTLDAIVYATGGKIVTLEVTSPLGGRINARYGVLKDNTAVIEIAEAAGITLVKQEERNPMYTTTRGVGELIRHAIVSGCRNFVVGLGGSVTNDGGVGMLSALGFEFLDKNGKPIADGACGLENLFEIKTENALRELAECSFTLASDVENPLCGECGATRVFSPQKGAGAEDMPRMDAWLDAYADITKKVLPDSDKNARGMGAAGGLGFAFASFLKAKIRSGIELVTELTEVEKHISTSDIVVTGEGRLDSQTAMGKAPVGIAKIAKKYNKTVIAFSGCVTADAEILSEHGIDAYFPILRNVTTLDEALDDKNSFENLRATAVQVFRLIKKMRG